MSPYALVPSLALSIGGILGGGALPRRPFNTAVVLASCPLLAEGVGSSSILPPLPGTFSWCLLLCCHCPRAPPAIGTPRTGALSQRLRPVPRPVVPHIPALNRTDATDRQLVLVLPTATYDIDRGALVGMAQGFQWWDPGMTVHCTLVSRGNSRVKLLKGH